MHDAQRSRIIAPRVADFKCRNRIDRDEIPGSAHFLMMEKPDEFNQLLTGFLRKVYP
jgi:pimeloyl-ACP methyl ester carboxylesterase